MDVCKTFSIESARSLPHLPEDHPCRNIHGHSFKITLTVSGTVDRHTGFVMDVGDMDIIFDPIREQIDHAYLNDVCLHALEEMGKRGGYMKIFVYYGLHPL